MNNKSWLSNINLIALILVIAICLSLVFLLTSDRLILFGFAISALKIPFLVFVAIVLVGFYILLMLNYATSPQGKSGWIILIASIVFLPTVLCLVALAFPLLFIK